MDGRASNGPENSRKRPTASNLDRVASRSDDDDRAARGSGDRESARGRTILGRQPGREGPVGNLGVHRAPDGSDGGPIALDLSRPHAALVVGKRGSGKSYTLGVIAEELARTEGIAPVVVDPMGAFDTLERPARGRPVPATVLEGPTVHPDALDPRAWCELLGLDPESGPGSLLWRAAADASRVSGMRSFVEAADVPAEIARGAKNHLELADTWGAFDPDGVGLETLASGAVTVLDVSHLERAPIRAITGAVASRLYRASVDDRIDRFPWLLVDEAHSLFEGVAADALCRLLTRGRHPGVSLVLATQRPGSLPDVAASQADLVIAHQLTGRPDREALMRARPTLDDHADRRQPTAPGEATVVDDALETVRSVRVRERDTPHGGTTPRIESGR